MAILYPFSRRTAETLAQAPAAGETHYWLAQVAGGLRHTISSSMCMEYLRQCCDSFVKHRSVPDREISAAVRLAYASAGNVKSFQTHSSRRSIPQWPERDSEAIQRVLGTISPLFDVAVEAGITASDALSSLFRPGEFVCTGPATTIATIRKVEDTISDAEHLQFVVPNPMQGLSAINNAGEPSIRCQNNVLARRYLIIEVDDLAIPKPEQAKLASLLSKAVPLVMAVDSGGKSLHSWFAVEAMPVAEQAKFFSLACSLGADRALWNIASWVRMPGGLRIKGDHPPVRQRIVYFSRNALMQVKQTTQGALLP